MVNHKQRKHNQSKGNDQLQTANHKDKRAIRDLTENPYHSLNQSGHRNDEHEGHRDIKHPALTASSLKEHCETGQHKSGKELVR